jgi:hypothetical protein
VIYVTHPGAILQSVLAHKKCGGYVRQESGMKQWGPDFYVCPKCNTLMHKNNVEVVDAPLYA